MLTLEQPFVQPSTAIATRVSGAPIVLDVAGYYGLGTAPGTGANARASTGQARVPKTFTFYARNSIDTGDQPILQIDGAGNVYIGDATAGNATYVRGVYACGLATAYGYNLTCDAAGIKATGNHYFAKAVSSPSVYHETDDTNDVVADDLEIYAQGVSGSGGTHAHAGNLGLRGGRASGLPANTDGNVWVHVSPGALATWQAMEKGIYVANCVTAPTGDPTGGGFLYVVAGAATWRGTSGTVTTFGAAAPHCKECGHDYWSVACENARYGTRLMVCGWCGHTVKQGPATVLDKLTAEELASCI